MCKQMKEKEEATNGFQPFLLPVLSLIVTLKAMCELEKSMLSKI